MKCFLFQVYFEPSQLMKESRSFASLLRAYNVSNASEGIFPHPGSFQCAFFVIINDLLGPCILKRLNAKLFNTITQCTTEELLTHFSSRPDIRKCYLKYDTHLFPESINCAISPGFFCQTSLTLLGLLSCFS